MKRKINRIYFELTTLCNLECTHCFNYNENLKKKFLEYEAIKEFYRNICNKTQGIVLTGGEPFLHPHLEDILELLKTERVVITTNATLFDKYYYEKLLEEYPNVFLQISFDGFSEETFEAVRGPKTYKRVREVVDYLSLKNYGKRVGLSMSILACNAKEVEKVISFARDKGLHSVHFPTLIIEGRCERDMSMLPDIASLNAVEDKLLKLAAESKNLEISVNTLDRIAAEVRGNGGDNCLSNATLKITVDGNIMPCPVAWRREERIGYINEVTSFSNLEKMLNEIKYETNLDNHCITCEGNSICNRNYCEFCSIRKTNNNLGQQYRCKNLRHHYKNILKEGEIVC